MLGISSKYELLNGETLLVREANSEDAGKYSCGATNHITSQTSKAPGN